jgi:hypothetical protein
MRASFAASALFAVTLSIGGCSSTEDASVTADGAENEVVSEDHEAIAKRIAADLIEQTRKEFQRQTEKGTNSCRFPGEFSRMEGEPGSLGEYPCFAPVGTMAHGGFVPMFDEVEGAYSPPPLERPEGLVGPLVYEFTGKLRLAFTAAAAEAFPTATVEVEQAVLGGDVPIPGANFVIEVRPTEAGR